MRAPSEYITKAVTNLRSRLARDCGVEMTFGECSHTVTRVGNLSRGADDVSGDGPAEAERVICLSHEFPTLTRGDAVELNGAPRVVTSVRSDPTRTSIVVGLSAEFDRVTATARGRGRACPLDVLFVASGESSSSAYSSAHIDDERYTVAARVADWPFEEGPEVGWTLEIAPDGFAIRLKISSVRRQGGWYIFNCRTRTQ